MGFIQLVQVVILVSHDKVKKQTENKCLFLEGGRGGRLDETYSEKEGGKGDYSEERKKAFNTIHRQF